MMLQLIPLVLVTLILITAVIYRVINPLPKYPITLKLYNCVIGHRIAPVLHDNDNNDIHHVTDDHTKGVYDENNFIIPENCLTSLKRAQQTGIKTIELDVQITLDKQPVIFHDTIIGNTLHCSEQDKNKRICDFTFAELEKMPFLCCEKQTNSPYINERVTLFSNVLQLCKEYDMNIMIEIKPQTFLKECCYSIVKQVLLHHMENNVYVASFSPIALLYIRQKTNQICTGYLFTGSATSNLIQELKRQNLSIPLPLRISIISWLIDAILRGFGHPWILWLCGNSIVIPQYTYISAFNASQYHTAGITVLTWTVNDSIIQKYMFERVGISIITDHPPQYLVERGTDVKYDAGTTKTM